MTIIIENLYINEGSDVQTQLISKLTLKKIKSNNITKTNI